MRQRVPTTEESYNYEAVWQCPLYSSTVEANSTWTKCLLLSASFFLVCRPRILSPRRGSLFGLVRHMSFSSLKACGSLPHVDGAAFDCCSCPTRSSPYVRAQVLLCLSLPCPSPTQHSRRASRAVRSFVAFMSLDFSHTQSVSMRVKWAPAVVSPATATPVATCLCGERQSASVSVSVNSEDASVSELIRQGDQLR